MGFNITIRRPDGTATAGVFGKVPDTDRSFSTVSSDEYGYRFTSMDAELLGGVRHEGGQFDSQEPRILLAHDTIVQPGDFIDFPDGLSYHVPEKLEDYQAYKIANGVLDTSE